MPGLKRVSLSLSQLFYRFKSEEVRGAVRGWKRTSACSMATMILPWISSTLHTAWSSPCAQSSWNCYCCQLMTCTSHRAEGRLGAASPGSKPSSFFIKSPWLKLLKWRSLTQAPWQGQLSFSCPFFLGSLILFSRATCLLSCANIYKPQRCLTLQRKLGWFTLSGWIPILCFLNTMFMTCTKCHFILLSWGLALQSNAKHIWSLSCSLALNLRKLLIIASNILDYIIHGQCSLTC